MDKQEEDQVLGDSRVSNKNIISGGSNVQFGIAKILWLPVDQSNSQGMEVKRGG